MEFLNTRRPIRAVPWLRGRLGAPRILWPLHKVTTQFIKNVGFNSKTRMVDCPCSNPCKTCRLLTLLNPFLQNVSKRYPKSIMLISKSGWRFTTLQNVKKPLVLAHFEASRKVHKTSYQIVVYGDFGGNFRKMDLKSIKNIRFPLKVECVLRLCTMSKKHWS